jgi:hypothetical protein
MCCFSTKTEVFRTSIFARITRPGEQLLVYQMRYAASAPTAMILPLPVALPAREGSVRWKSLKDRPAFFDDLAAGFPEPQHFGFPTKSDVEVAAPLAVHEVGDFVASFVPTVADFDRVDPRFAIRKDVWGQIPGYHDHGFAVFQLKELTGTPHPIAFEFETRLRDQAFFPTVHIHDGTVHAQDVFDHVLYLQEARFDARVGSYDGPEHADPSTGFVRSKEKAASFAAAAGDVLDGGLLLHRTTLIGMHSNIDTLIGLAPRAATMGCGRCAVETNGAETSARLGAAPAALAGLAWLIRRRDRLRRS